MNSKLLLSFAALSTIMLVSVGCAPKKTPASALEEKFTVKKINLRDVISNTGEVQPVVKVELKCEASGKIEKIFVKEGQKISKRDTILIIDPSRLLTQKEKLEIGIKRSKIEMQVADRDYTNGMELIKTGSVSDKKLQDLQNSRDIAQLNFQQQQLELKDILDQLGKTVITSPMSGVITSLLVNEGEIAVSATSGFQSGTSIGTIADISKLEVVTSIGEVDYIHLSKGQKVVIRPEAIEGAKTGGSVSFVALSAKKRNNEELSTFEVRVAIDSIIPGIAPGINVNVDFVILERKDILGIPYHFVTKEREKTLVDVVKKGVDGKDVITQKPIQVGATDYRMYEIVSGLKEGDEVYFKMDDPTEKKPGAKKGKGVGLGALGR